MLHHMTSRTNPPDSTTTLAQRWPNIGPKLVQRRLETLAQRNFDCWANVRVTVANSTLRQHCANVVMLCYMPSYIVGPTLEQP